MIWTFDKPHAVEIERRGKRRRLETALCHITGYREDGDTLAFDFIDDPSHYGFPSIWLAEDYCAISIFDNAGIRIGLYLGK